MAGGIFSRTQPERPSGDGKRAQPAAYGALRPLVGAAARVNTKNKFDVEKAQLRKRDAEEWQSEAWEYYDSIGEIKFAFNSAANLAAQCSLFIGWVDDPGHVPVDMVDAVTKYADAVPADFDKATRDILSRLGSGFGGQAGLIHDAALNVQVVGECYLTQTRAVPYDVTDPLALPKPETWDIRSVDEVVIGSDGNAVLRTSRSQSIAPGRQANQSTALDPNAFLGRVWRPHPRYSDEADSSLRGLLDLCAELLLLNRTFRATSKSRLNAGMLYIPDGLSAAADNGASELTDALTNEDGSPNANEGTADSEDDAFEEALIDSMVTPIADETSAAAVVPLIIRGPADLGEKIKQFKFERSFDEAMTVRADRVLERILQGLDYPKDLVTGLANVKYANAMQIDEQLYKTHIEPMMLLIVDSLTVLYLQPALRALGYSEDVIKRTVVWYDPTKIITGDDRGQDADNGFDRMAVSWASWRHNHGFSDADAPSQEEIAVRTILEKGQIGPEVVVALLTAIAPETMGVITGNNDAASPTGDEGAVPDDIQEVLDSGTMPPADAASPPPVDLPLTPSEAPA